MEIAVLRPDEDGNVTEGVVEEGDLGDVFVAVGFGLAVPDDTDDKIGAELLA